MWTHSVKVYRVFTLKLIDPRHQLWSCFQINWAGGSCQNPFSVNLCTYDELHINSPFHRVLAIPISQSLLITSLQSTLAEASNAPSAKSVVWAGPSALDALAQGDPSVLHVLRQAYASGLRHTYIFALVNACIAWCWTLGMQWLNVKREAQARMEASDSATLDMNGNNEKEKERIEIDQSLLDAALKPCCSKQI